MTKISSTTTTSETSTSKTTKAIKEITCKKYHELPKCHELNGVCYCGTGDNVDSWESANSLCKRLNASLLNVDTDEKYNFWNNLYKNGNILKSWVCLFITKALHLYESVSFLDWG